MPPVPKWKKAYLLYLKSPLWRAKVREIRKRDNNRCIHCHRSDRDNVTIQVHHRNYDNIFHEKPEDLETICSICHADIHEMPVSGHPNKVGLIMKQLWGEIGG